MRKLTLSLLGILAVLPCWGAAAPDTNRIVAPGIAVADVPPDELTIDFQLESVAPSFEEGAAKARTVAAEIGSIAPPFDAIKLSVSHDLTFMQQKKWTSGTKLQHNFRLLVEGVPDGRAEKAMVAIVESARKTNPDLTVVAFDARLSDARVKQIQTALLKQAIADAHDFAIIAAAEANLTVKAVRVLRIGGPSSSSRPYELEESVTVDYFRSAKRSFSVRDELAATIRVSVNVMVEYDCDPM